MSIKSEIKKAGIEIIQQLSEKDVFSIASNIASKLCLAFPEHSLNRTILISSLSGISMYIAIMPDDYSSAKYFYKNNSIYFKEYSTPEKMSTIAVHECIHFIQELTDENYKLVRMGLYKLDSGLAINEAAVQLMSAEANNCKKCEEKYYGINIKTISPDFYPLECAILNQMAYFTGTYPLYHSTINSNDVFENTFNMHAGTNAYSTISKSLDDMLIYESDLNFYINELQNTDEIYQIRKINKKINKLKEQIQTTFYKSQNYIIKNCFNTSFNNIKNLDDINVFQKKLYKFQGIIGYSDEYTFYNDFYRNMMNLLENKRSFIIEHGPINLFKPETTKALVALNTAKESYGLIKTLMIKLKKLLKINSHVRDINSLD